MDPIAMTREHDQKPDIRHTEDKGRPTAPDYKHRAAMALKDVPRHREKEREAPLKPGKNAALAVDPAEIVCPRGFAQSWVLLLFLLLGFGFYFVV